MRHPLLVLDDNLRVERINRAFLEMFKVKENETQGVKLYELGNGQWDIPELRELLETVLPQDSEVRDYRVKHTFERIGERTLVMNAYKMPEGANRNRVLVSIEDVSDREQARWELEGQKEYAQRIVDASRDSLLILGWDLRVRSANKTFYETFRVHPSETEERLVYELGNGQWDIPRLRSLLEEILPQNNVFDDFEVRHDFDTIGPKTFLLNARRIDHVQLILLAIEDVTMARDAAALIEASEARFRGFVAASSDVMYRMSPDWSEMRSLDGRGLLRDAVTDKSWLDTYIVEDDKPRVLGAMATAMGKKEPFALEHRVYKADGTQAWTASRAVPVFDQSGEITEWLGTATDVTAVRQAQEKLQSSERQLAALVEGVPAAIGVLGADGAVKLANRAFTDLIPDFIPSRDPERVSLWRSWDVNGKPIAPHDFPGARALRGEKVTPGLEMLYGKEGGEQFWKQFASTPIHDDKGEVVGAVCAISDIDEVKRSQFALRKSEERLRNVLNSMAEGFALFSPTFIIIEVNEETLRLDGRRRDELVGRSHWDAFPGTEQSELGHFYKRIMAERVPGEIQFRYLWPDGRDMWVDVRAYPTPDGGVACFWRDITQQKLSADALRESEERYRSLFDSMDEAYAVVEVLKDARGTWHDFRFLEVNPAFLVHTTMPYPVGKTATELLGTPNPRWARMFGKALDTNEPLRVEETEATLGLTFDLNVFTLDKERNRVAVLFTNITERKRTEMALRVSEERYRAILQSARDYAIFTTDVDGIIQTWPPGAEAVFGWTANEAIGKNAAMTFTAEDRENNVPEWEMAQARVKNYSPNVRWHLRKDGGRVFIEGSTRPLADGRGFLKVGQDVTERKQWEERQAVLVTELQHRTRNLIGVVKAMAERTARASSDLADFRERFQDRIEALARVQGLLSRLDTHDRVTFDELITTEMSAMGGGEGKVRLNGPSNVRLRSSTVQTLAMALHELATNSVKYGALRQENGRLFVSWSLVLEDDGKHWLRVEWREVGVAMPPAGAAPQGSGQGRELIEKALPYQLKAKTSYIMSSTGVHCDIVIPVSETMEEAAHV
ncbi:PAS domain S-box protein [Rhizobium cauense]|nr:PAS domain S-box protein [Rhizobium cauense]